MNLVDRDQRRAGQDCRASPTAVFGDGSRIVVRAESDIEPGDDPGGDATAPAEEPVRNPRQGRGADDFDPISQGSW